MFKNSVMRKAAVGLTAVILSMGGMETANAGPFSHLESLGDVMMAMAPAYALGMTVMEKDWKGTLQLAESLAASQLVVEGLKMLEIEQRPNGKDMRSFPSGHAAGVFSGAMFVHKRYGWKPALIPYAMGLVTSYSRVQTKSHYVHDVLAGAAISALFTWILVDKYLPDGVTVSADTESVQLGFSMKF